MIKNITVTFQIKDTDSNFNEIQAAIAKGLYYGLDIKHVCKPKQVKLLKVSLYNEPTTIQDLEDRGEIPKAY